MNIVEIIDRKLTLATVGIGMCFLLILSAVTLAQGPRVIAIGDRHLWREPVDARAGFDRASRAAILIYAKSLQEQRDAESRRLERPSVVKWLDNELASSVTNYQLAAKSCSDVDWTCAGIAAGPADLGAKAGRISVPANLSAWRAGMERFAADYIAEQVRLAALFPRTTSEIDMFDANEFNGDRLGDRKFFLTFDDGPTAAGGNTDGVLQMLAANGKKAVFFLLGGNLKSRLRETNAAQLANAYRGQCVASHGWEHLSHAASGPWRDGRTWRSSVTETESLLRATFADDPALMPLFRPPYGERRPDSSIFFGQQALRIALWDLDSQDWNSRLDADDATNRIETLMLIKRHGVLLFHDIHPKARTAVPTIIRDFATAVEWGDCRQIAEAY